MDFKLFLTLLPSVIASIAEVARVVPGASSATIARYLDLLAAITGQAEPAYAELMMLKEHLAEMARMQREPSADEWRVLEARSDAAHAEIQAYDLDAEDVA